MKDGWERVALNTGRKGMAPNTVKLGKHGLSLSPDLFEGRDLGKLRLEPYIKAKERLIGFKASRNGYTPRRPDGTKAVQLQCKGTLNLLDPRPRHRGVYPARWDGDMLTVDFKEDTE